MPHPAEIIELVCAHLERDYPSDQYAYLIEKYLLGLNMSPDVMIRDRSGTVVCLVEIGYTRPEKLAAYRASGVSDVRWYGKDGRLYTPEPARRTVIERVSYQSVGGVAVYALKDVTPCMECLGHYKRQDYLSAEEDASEGVITWVVTDYQRAFLPSHCDKCDRYWLADKADALGICQALEDSTAPELGRLWGPRQLLSWDDTIAQFTSIHEGLVMCYGEGIRLNRDEAR